jgi:putative hydrolase of the HAD superfamily
MSLLNQNMNQIRVVLFDVGGVLVELSGVPTMLAWMGDRASSEELWRMWLTSPTVRAFETGRATPEAFAERLIAEMQLPVSRDHLLEEFTRWPRDLYPGTLEVIRRVPQRYMRATLCNSNVLHWPRMMNEMRLGAAFDHHFASHLMGKIKPDEEVFHHVTANLACRAEEVLFMDDNQLNVDAAKKVGMKAFQVKGIAAAEKVLVEAGVIER